MTSLVNRLYELYNLGYYNKVVSIAEAEIQNYVACSDSAKIQAASYFRLGDFQKCHDILLELEKIYDTEPDYLSLYATTSRRLGHLEKSSQLFKLALSIEPNSLPIKNNYANLLIDLDQLDDAEKLLDEVLSTNPTYEDALQNKNRLEFLKSEKKSDHPTKSLEHDSSALLDLGDPLLLAFADDEVERSSKRYKFKKGDHSHNSNLPVPDVANSVQDFLKMAYQASSTGDYAFAFRLCSQSLHQIGPQAVIYDCVSDLHLNLKNFRESEMCLLHAISLDGPSPKRLLNLCNFASMRGDIKLAKHYLQSAAALDPSHPQLQLISESLEKKSSNSPFQFKSESTYPEIN